MKLLLTLPIIALLSGCWKTIPTFPEPPKDLLESCGTLEKANSTELQEFLKTVVKNYEHYYVCKSKNDTWIQWYKESSKNYKEALK